MNADTRDHVLHRAEGRCEYCGLRQEHSDLTHHVEHIIARQHGGPDGVDNLALCCHRCNHHKGPNLSGIDPTTRDVVPLYHPDATGGRTISRSKAFGFRDSHRPGGRPFMFWQ